MLYQNKYVILQFERINELWNEIDAPEVVWRDNKSYHSNQSQVTNWHKEMITYIKSLDGNYKKLLDFVKIFPHY